MRVGGLSRLVLAAEPKPFWLDRPDAPPARAPLRGEVACDLAVIGGGFSGLWTALLAKEADPERAVVLVEGRQVGWAASGRNGGFCEASLTHGAANGRDRFPAEFGTLQRLGAQNLNAIEAALDRHGIACDFERTGSIGVATSGYQVEGLRSAAEAGDGTFLDTSAIRGEVNSPTYLAGVWDKAGSALVHPGRLAWGLAAACERLGVRVFERTPATGLASDASGVSVRVADGVLRARRVALGTSAFPCLVRRLRPYTARAARLPGRPGHPLVPGPRRPQLRPQEPVAPRPGRRRHGLRLLALRSGRFHDHGPLPCSMSSTTTARCA